MAGGVFFRDFVGDAGQLSSEFVEAGAGYGTDGNDGRAFEKGSLHQLAGFEAGKLQDVGFGEIGFGEGDHAAANAEQTADVEVFASLGLDGLVSGDDE